MMSSNLFKSLPGVDVLDFGAIFLTVYLLFRIVSVRQKRSNPLVPPGPNPLPFVGNIFDLPKGLEGPHWAKHKALYGPISSIKAFGKTFIIVNDRTVAVDLLDKRSMIYSDRPWLPFGGEMVGFDRWLTTLKPYDKELKLHRKHFHKFIGSRSALSRFERLEETETRRFLLQVLNNPTKFLDYIRALPGTLILKMSYGYTTDAEGSDPLVSLADEVMGDIFSNACAYGNWTVDILPFVRFLPDWLPGMSFKRKGREWAKLVASFNDRPYAFVQHQKATGNATDSFISESLEKEPSGGEGEHILKSIAASLYAGGSDTTVSAISTFYLAMVLHPDALKRAQEEIDLVVGPDRLPSFSDRKDLPYIEALVQETLRWENVGPVNVPHKVAEDDLYMGYTIPKGSVIVANIWQMTHDLENYHDPEKFKPERFLGENGRAVELDPRTLVFGFGRRICPGKELADSTLFIAIAMSVAVFDICKSKDEFGNDVEPLYEYVSGLISRPKPFECMVTPRSEKAIGLIQSILDESPPAKGDGDILRGLSP